MRVGDVGNDVRFEVSSEVIGIVSSFGFPFRPGDATRSSVIG